MRRSHSRADVRDEGIRWRARRLSEAIMATSGYHGACSTARHYAEFRQISSARPSGRQVCACRLTIDLPSIHEAASADAGYRITIAMGHSGGIAMSTQKVCLLIDEPIWPTNDVCCAAAY